MRKGELSELTQRTYTRHACLTHGGMHASEGTEVATSENFYQVCMPPLDRIFSGCKIEV